MKIQTNERGATALIVAGALFFIFGAATLAVDASSLYQDATTDQTTADLACLAGVQGITGYRRGDRGCGRDHPTQLGGKDAERTSGLRLGRDNE